MSEPYWIEGDDYARGQVTECPKCEEVSYEAAHGLPCPDCGFGGGDDEA